MNSQLSNSTAHPTPWSTIPGPAHRESFFAAQRRHRFASWLFTILCALAMLLIGIPLSIAVTPLVLIIVCVGADLLNLLIPTPDLASQLLLSFEPLFRSDDSLRQVSASNVLAVAMIFLLPGSFTMLLLWVQTRRLVLRAGTEGILHSLNARLPRSDDWEEQQLVNVVAEMALAAGLKPPRVLLFDIPIANAAALGTSTDDITVLVSRQLLDDLDRDETQGVIAHLVGSAGNGDLRLSLTILSVYAVFGTILTFFGSASSSEARRIGGRLLRALLRPRGNAQADAQVVKDMLNPGLRENDTVNSALGCLFLPVMILELYLWVTQLVFNLFILGPLLALMWRHRRYLADATAVQLTRHPDGLARALTHLAEYGAAVPGNRYAAHLFIIGEEAAQDRATAKRQRRMGELQRRAKGQSMAERMKLAHEASEMFSVSAALNENNTAQESALDVLIPLQPPLHRRIKRLHRLGATVDLANPYPTPTYHWLFQGLAYLVLTLVVGPLFAMILGLVLTLVVMTTYLGLLGGMFLIVVVVMPLHMLLR